MRYQIHIDRPMANPSPEIYEPALFGFSDLFYGAEVKPTLPETLERRLGFHHGASVLLTGGPGSGKTTFAVASARDLLFRYRSGGLLSQMGAHETPHENSEQPRPSQPIVPKPSGVNRLYYISLETNRSRLEHMYREMGWMGNDELFAPNKDHLFEFVPEFDGDRPPPTPEETLNSILGRIRDMHLRHDPGDQKIIVIVDSLNALLRDCADRGEARRQTHEFLLRLKKALGQYQHADVQHDRLALALLISEDAETRRINIPVSEYVTDFVFRLDTQDTEGNRKLRTIEAIKSQGANLRIGRHTWAIVSKLDCHQVFTQKVIIDRLEWSSQHGWPPPDIRIPAKDYATYHDYLNTAIAKYTTDNSSWGTIAIFARAGLRPIGTKQDLSIDPGHEYLFSGIPGLDAMLALREDYWARAALYFPRQESREIRGIIAGTTTLVIGPAGTGKTTMSLQFLQGDAVSQQNALQPFDALYVNFENTFDHVLRLYPGNKETLKNAVAASTSPTRQDTADEQPSTPDSHHAPKPKLRLHTLHRRRANLDPNVLIAEIRYLLAVYPNITRIAIDGLASLLATTEPSDYRALAETIITSIQSARIDSNTVSILLTYESSPEHEAAPPAHLSGNADNLVILRQIPIGNERRTCIEVAKARFQRHDRMVREVRVVNTSGAKDIFELPLAIRPGFENYAGILEKKIRPVEVYLQLFAENGAEEMMNKWLATALKANFDYKVHEFGFSRHAISRTLDDLTSDATRIPTSDIRLLSVDEWWIRDHPIDHHPLLWLVPLEPQVRESREFHKADPIHTGLATSLTDFWAPEVEKACLIDFNTPLNKQSVDQMSRRTRLMALPCYMDFGLFCVNLRFDPRFEGLGESTRSRNTSELNTSLKARWNSLQSALPRVWATPKGKWFSRTKEPRIPEECATLCDTAAYWKQPELFTKSSEHMPPKWLFAFDMEVPETTFSTFLELAWSFGAREDFIVTNTIDLALSQAASIESDSPPPKSGPLRYTDDIIDDLPAASALRFLMYLVHETLMSTSPNLDDARQSVFSRLYYSNFVHLTLAQLGTKPPTTTSHKGKDILGKLRIKSITDAESPPSEPLITIPFFPIGLTDRRDSILCFKEAFDDLVFRFQRLARRIVTAVVAASCPNKGETSQHEITGSLLNTILLGLLEIISEASRYRNEVEQNGIADDNARHACSALLGLGEKLKTYCWTIHDANLFLTPGFHNVSDLVEHLCRALNQSPFDAISGGDDERRRLLLEASTVASFDIRDAIEILEWHNIRLRLLTLQLNGQSITQERIGQHLTESEISETPSPTESAHRTVTALTGYPCTGSWMIGLFRNTQSPGLSSKYMEEICSLESSQKRARLGAGMPSRKDFYDFHGDESATFAEYLSWNQLYRSLGSRARRRERAICSFVPVSRLTQIIQEEVRSCLLYARDQQLREGSNVESQKDAESAMIKRARSSIRRILNLTADLMREGCNNSLKSQPTRPKYCADCPQPQVCSRLLDNILDSTPRVKANAQ